MAKLLSNAPHDHRVSRRLHRARTSKGCRRARSLQVSSSQVNPRLVRGLDYYNLTVFEWITDEFGSQGTLCGGGRYDTLIELLGGKPTPGNRICNGHRKSD